jgi:formylmethanofuran dehydrogenase subunit E
MATLAQKKAAAEHRRRTRAHGLVRVESQVPAQDAALVREVAKALRTAREEELRARLREALAPTMGQSLADLFRNMSVDVSGPEYDEAFDIPRDQSGWRPIDL